MRKEANGKTMKTEKKKPCRRPVWLRKITEFMFVCTMGGSLLVIANTCALAWYSTIVLQQPYPLEDLATQLGITMIGAIAAKVVGNIFEHNDGENKQE